MGQVISPDSTEHGENNGPSESTWQEEQLGCRALGLGKDDCDCICYYGASKYVCVQPFYG